MSTRRIVFVAFPDFQTLDVAGPIDVFGLASRTLQQACPGREPAYELALGALRSGPLTSSTGLTSYASYGLLESSDSIDTLLVAGGPGALDASKSEPLVETLRRLAPQVRRVGSVARARSCWPLPDCSTAGASRPTGKRSPTWRPAIRA